MIGVDWFSCPLCNFHQYHRSNLSSCSKNPKTIGWTFSTKYHTYNSKRCSVRFIVLTAPHLWFQGSWKPIHMWKSVVRRSLIWWNKQIVNKYIVQYFIHNFYPPSYASNFKITIHMWLINSIQCHQFILPSWLVNLIDWFT